MKFTYVAELGWTGYEEMSVFHGLSGGKIVHAEEPGVGVGVGVRVGVRVFVGWRAAVASEENPAQRRLASASTPMADTLDCVFMRDTPANSIPAESFHAGFIN